jgi:hypothetical protein
MSAVLFPIAATAEAALVRPLGRAARAVEASGLAGGVVAFASELTGPAFPTREAALDAYAGRLDDERPGRAVLVQPEDRYCDLHELAVDPASAGERQRPVFEGGRRWPKPRAAPATAWRLSVSYWRTAAAEAILTPPAGEPEKRRGQAQPADVEALRQRAARPLQPVKPQQPLDIGLFEVRPPDAPHIVMPDE